MLNPARLVFIDETAVSTNMVRLRGRIARGVRLIGRVPLGQWKTITFVAALRHNKMTAPMVIEGAMNGEMFLAYVEQCLVPVLRRDDIVVMDKLVKIGGEGGLIALDAKGNIELPFNSDGMYRASKKSNRDLFIGIYKD